MFGFIKTTTQQRFKQRLNIWKHYRFGRFRHYLHWLFHNIPVHLAIAIFPCKWTFKLHDWSSDMLAGEGIRKWNK